MKSIKTKLTLTLTAFLVIICIGLGWFSYTSSATALRSVTKELTIKNVTESARVIEERIQARFAELAAIANSEKIRDPEIDVEEKLQYLEYAAKRSGYPSLGLVDTEGNGITMSRVPVNLKERDYFQQALKGIPTVTDPIISREDNTSTIVNYAVPIFDSQGKVIGVLVGSQSGEELSSLINDITLGESGRAFMINKVGTTVAHENKEAVLNSENILELAKTDDTYHSLAQVISRMTQGETGFDEYNYQGVTKYAAYTPVNGTNWILAINIPKDEILSSLNSLQKSFLIYSSLFLSVGFVFVLWISGKLAKNFRAISNDLNVIAQGDFSQEATLKVGSKKDEITDTYQSMNTMKQSISAMIRAIQESASAIHGDAESLSSIAEQMASTSDNVSESIQETANGVNSQATSLANINEAVFAFGEKLDDLVKSIEEIDQQANSINQMSLQGNQDMESLINAIDKMENTFKDFTMKISGLTESIGEITSITNLINGIAEQTNLLALNAAIEAARAGEAGKGFGVVAGEIRKLAEQTQNASQEINHLIDEITGDASTIVDQTDGLHNDLNMQVNVINQAITAYQNIVQAVEAISIKIQQANNEFVAINHEKSAIQTRVEEASAVAEEVSASSEEISAASEELSASSAEVYQSAEKVKDLVQEMIHQINNFKIM